MKKKAIANYLQLKKRWGEAKKKESNRDLAARDADSWPAAAAAASATV